MAAKCPGCNLDNSSDSKFCRECGTPLFSTPDKSSSLTKTIVAPNQGLAPGSI
ncbi:MAG: zinc-ribbon domain-containing protein, partial [Candidatus Aminicenantales bacterium]